LVISASGVCESGSFCIGPLSPEKCFCGLKF
jgi:hypothetical protein